jgi:hypothetical protein
MKYYNMRLDGAYNFVKNKRNKIHPNEGFWQQLINFDALLYPNEEKIDFSTLRN